MIAVLVLTPIFTALLILIFGKNNCVRNFITVFSSTALFLVFISYICQDRLPKFVLDYFDFLNDREWKVPIIIPNIGLSFFQSIKGVVFAGMVSFLWAVANLYAIGYMKKIRDEHQQRFFFLFTISISCTFGVAFANDLVTIFTCYEFLTLSTYPLIIHSGTQEAVESGKKYLHFLLGSSLLLLLPAMIISQNLLGNGGVNYSGNRLAEVAPDYLCTILFITFAYGVGKVAIMPMHQWLTSAMVAPTPVSALLHAVAVVKSGIFVFLTINESMFRWEGPCFPIHYFIVAFLASVTVIMASVFALRSSDLKQILAYSTVSQLSYMILLIIFAQKDLFVIAYMIFHALAKITMFFAAGAIYSNVKTLDINKLHGIGRAMPITMICFTISVLSIIGLPGTALFLGKILVMNAVNMYIPLVIVFMMSTLLSTAYLLPIVYNAFFENGEHKVERVSLGMNLSMVITTTVNIAIFFVLVMLLPFHTLLKGQFISPSIF